MKKIEIVNELVKNGYHLMGESAESFASRFTLEDLEMFLDCYLHRVQVATGRAIISFTLTIYPAHTFTQHLH